MAGNAPPVPTLTTIAHVVGCSPSTVSRALRDNPTLPAATIKKVRTAAAQLGYQPNPLVSRLMRHMRQLGRPTSGGTIAFLVFGESRTEWEGHPTFVKFSEGAGKRAQELGFNLEVFWANEPGLNGARLTQILQARGINGVIVGPSPGLQQVPELGWEHFSAVKIGVPVPDLPLPCVSSNNFRGMVRVIAQLGRIGYNRLGLVLQKHQNIKTGSMWLAPFALHGQHVRPSHRVEPLVLGQWNAKDFTRWFEAHRPEVVIGLRSEVIEWLERAGLRVPADVGFVHLDRFTEDRVCAGLDQKSHEVGAAAMDLLSQLLMANERDLPVLSKQLLVDSVWVDGPTLRAAT